MTLFVKPQAVLALAPGVKIKDVLGEELSRCKEGAKPRHLITSSFPEYPEDFHAKLYCSVGTKVSKLVMVSDV